MASGQQVAEQNLAAFIAWAASKSDDDFREYSHRGKLKRSEIASECNFGKSALVQNPAIKNALEELEEGLRERGILPQLSEDAEEPTVRDTKANQSRQDSRRLNGLEQENAALRAELTRAKAMLDRFKLMAQFIDETGRMPR
jgi:hypothetical protein